MLNEIRLDGRQLALLHHAAEVAGAELLPEYAGEFRPASDRCIGLRATSPGTLVHFGALVAIALDLPDPLLLAMASRIQEDGPGNDARRVYYWPGILAGTTPEPEPVPAMLTVAGQRFACERCGATVFTRTGEVFACNGCGTEYAEPARVITS